MPAPQHSPEALASAPAAVVAIADAINAKDYDAFVAAFAPDGLVNDWGTVKRGPDGVRSWAHKDAIGAGAVMTLRSAITTGDVTEIRFDWVSSVFTGDGHGFVTIRDGRVTELKLVE